MGFSLKNEESYSQRVPMNFFKSMKMKKDKKIQIVMHFAFWIDIQFDDFVDCSGNVVVLVLLPG